MAPLKLLLRRSPPDSPDCIGGEAKVLWAHRNPPLGGELVARALTTDHMSDCAEKALPFHTLGMSQTTSMDTRLPHESAVFPVSTAKA